MTGSGRRDRLIKQKRIDAYRDKTKLPDPTLCTECGVLFTEGRWVWTETEATNANETVCPACRRIAERNPAGLISIDGDFYAEHLDEVTNLINNTEKAETLQRPMERVMKVERENGGAHVTTTGVHIARRIGDAINKAYGGDYDIEYLDAEKRVRIAIHRAE